MVGVKYIYIYIDLTVWRNKGAYVRLDRCIPDVLINLLKEIYC